MKKPKGKAPNWRYLGAVGLVLAAITIPAPAQASAYSGAVSWGLNNFGQLGDGIEAGPERCGEMYSFACSTVPVPVSGLEDATAVAAGDEHGVALLADGTVVAWGTNQAGSLGDGSGLPSSVPVAVSGLSEVVAITAGRYYSLALLNDGRVMAWGANGSGQLGDGSTADSEVPIEVSGLSNVVAISAGGRTSMALLNDGTVMAWGDNSSGDLGDESTVDRHVPVPVHGLAEVVAINAAGPLALRADGTVMAWGDNGMGELATGSNSGPESCSGEQTACSKLPMPVAGIVNAVSIAASGRHALVALSDGRALSWGRNDSGMLGTGSEVGPERCGSFPAGAPKWCSTRPVEVQGLSDVRAVVAGENHSLALLEDGTVASWGRDYSGQLGDGTNFDTPSPVRVDGLSGVSALVGSSDFSLAVGTIGVLPRIDELAPSSGPPGTTVAIRGSHLGGALAVRFGHRDATFSVASDSSITAVAPPGEGTVPVRVVTAGGTSIDAYYHPVFFNYEPAAVAASTDPSFEVVRCGRLIEPSGNHRSRRAARRICSFRQLAKRPQAKKRFRAANLKRGQTLYAVGRARVGPARMLFVPLHVYRPLTPGSYTLTVRPSRGQTQKPHRRQVEKILLR